MATLKQIKDRIRVQKPVNLVYPSSDGVLTMRGDVELYFVGKCSAHKGEHVLVRAYWRNKEEWRLFNISKITNLTSREGSEVFTIRDDYREEDSALKDIDSSNKYDYKLREVDTSGN